MKNDLKESLTIKNDMIKELIGKTCDISLNSLVDNPYRNVTITGLEGTWLKIKTKKETILVNIDYISSIRTEAES